VLPGPTDPALAPANSGSKISLGFFYYHSSGLGTSMGISSTMFSCSSFSKAPSTNFIKLEMSLLTSVDWPKFSSPLPVTDIFSMPATGLSANLTV